MLLMADPVNRGGRPPLAPERRLDAVVSTKMSVRMHAALCRKAAQEGRTLADVMREAVMRMLRDERGGGVRA